MHVVVGACGLHEISRPPVREPMVPPSVEQYLLSLPPMLVCEIAHRPVIFDPGDEAFRTWNAIQCVPPAEHVGAMQDGLTASPNKRGIGVIALQRGMPFGSIVRAVPHAVGRVGDERVKVDCTREHLAGVAAIQRAPVADVYAAGLAHGRNFLDNFPPRLELRSEVPAPKLSKGIAAMENACA